jgi:hypothetical protein
MKIYKNYDEILSEVTELGKSTETLGYTSGGLPLISIRTGGDKLPAIFVTAGSHSTEHAGVSASMDLLTSLETNHQVYIYPTRDPIGMNGFAYALSLALGRVPVIESYEQVDSLLREEGYVVYEEDEMLLAIIGEYGYSYSRPTDSYPDPQYRVHQNLVSLSKNRAELVEPFRGRRVFIPAGQPEVEGAGEYDRAFTFIVAPDGEVLHLNRFHDTKWSPPEAFCARKLLEKIQPGLSFDLHESQFMEDRYWLSPRHLQDPEDDLWETRIATEIVSAIKDNGAVLAFDKDIDHGKPIKDTCFYKSEPGVYWLDDTIRGEGLNLSDFISRNHGLIFGTETGMYGEFRKRVELAKITVETAVKIFEERFV